MCLATAYLNKDGERELILERVTFIEVAKKKLLLRTLFGEQMELEAGVKEIDFASSSIILEKLRQPVK